MQEQLSDFCEHKCDMKVAEKTSQPKGAMKSRAKILFPGGVYGPLM